MAIQRSINFVGAMHEMRAERRRPERAPLRNPDGTFGRSAIMTEACRQARMLRGGLSWQRRIAICLRSVWQSAKMEGGRSYSSRGLDRRWSRSRDLSLGARP